MRRLVFLHLWLCALLAFQPTSVRVPVRSWVQASAETEPGDAPATPLTEEEEIPGLRASSMPRIEAPAEQSLPPPLPVRRESEPRLAVAPLCGDAARGHWRAVLLAPLRPLDDDPIRTA